MSSMDLDRHVAVVTVLMVCFVIYDLTHDPV